MTMKILLVDDNNDMRYTVKIALKTIDASYKIFEAKSGEDCLNFLKKNKPDIILMDIMMPGLDGLETTAQIREEPKYTKIKIIFLSATTDNKSKEMARLVGDDFIEKPFEPDELDKIIKKHFKKK